MRFHPKWIIGRTIVGVRMNPFKAHDAANGRKLAHSPVLTLDNGAELAFYTEETDFGEYGTGFYYVKPPTRKRI